MAVIRRIRLSTATYHNDTKGSLLGLVWLLLKFPSEKAGG